MPLLTKNKETVLYEYAEAYSHERCAAGDRPLIGLVVSSYPLRT